MARKNSNAKAKVTSTPQPSSWEGMAAKEVRTLGDRLDRLRTWELPEYSELHRKARTALSYLEHELNPELKESRERAKALDARDRERAASSPPLACPSSSLREACLLIARTYYGKRGLWAYEAWEYINETFYGNRLPWPNIVWAITPHGKCLGQTRSAVKESAPPVITLHPSLLGGTQKEAPWGINPSRLGPMYAFDVLLHESMHVSVNYLLAPEGRGGSSSHNNQHWVSEVNRIAPMIGLPGGIAGESKVRRVRIHSEPGDTKKRSKVQRVNEGSVPFDAIASFPHPVFEHFGLADERYSRGSAPFPSRVGL